MANKIISATSKNYYTGDPNGLVIIGIDTDPEVDIDNPRLDRSSNSKEPQQAMVDSMGIVGNIEPVEVIKITCDTSDPLAFIGQDGKPQKYKLEVNFGRWRIRAARKYNEQNNLKVGDPGYVQIKFMIAGRHDSNQIMAQRMMVENHHRRSIDPIEEAKEIQRLASLGMDIKELANALGMSVSSINNKLSLNKLTPNLQDKVSSGDLGPSVSYELSKLDNQEDQELAAEVLTEDNRKPSIQQTREVVQQIQNQNEQLSANPTDVQNTSTESVVRPVKPRKPNKAQIVEMRDALKGRYPQIESALSWVLTGNTEEFTEAIKSFQNEDTQDMPPMKPAQESDALGGTMTLQ